MTTLICGLLLFFMIHSLPRFPGIRAQFINLLGKNGYKACFSLASFISLAIIVKGKSTAEFIDLWRPFEFTKTLSIPLMLIAITLFISSNIPNNSKRITPHPIAWSVIIWSFAHLLANGDMSSLLLFGVMGLYAATSIVSANKRGSTINTDKQPLKNDILIITVGIITFAILFYFHGKLFGAQLL